MIELDRYIEDLEERICPEEEERIRQNWLDWAEHRNKGPFMPTHRTRVPSKLEWPHVLMNDALADEELAVYRELESVNGALQNGSPYVLRVRANYGVGIVARAFGLREFLMTREQDSLPNVYSVGEEGIRTILERPIPDLDTGSFGQTFRVTKRFLKIMEDYPKLGKALWLEHPDLQGPLDNLELMWGSDIFYYLYDDPELVHSALALVTGTIERYMDKWLALVPPRDGLIPFFAHVEKGGITLRDDSAMNLSPAFFDEFMRPYDERLLRKYGGIIHFCGRGDHFIGSMARIEGLRGINMSQPHLNDMEKVFRETVDRGVHLSLGVPPFEVKGHDVSNLVFL